MIAIRQLLFLSATSFLLHLLFYSQCVLKMVLNALLNALVPMALALLAYAVIYLMFTGISNKLCRGSWNAVKEQVTVCAGEYCITLTPSTSWFGVRVAWSCLCLCRSKGTGAPLCYDGKAHRHSGDINVQYCTTSSPMGA
jgi:hypothetical protein